MCHVNWSKGDAALDSVTGNKEDIMNVVNPANGSSENVYYLF
jgi:hypothetical protein